MCHSCVCHMCDNMCMNDARMVNVRVCYVVSLYIDYTSCTHISHTETRTHAHTYTHVHTNTHTHTHPIQSNQSLLSSLIVAANTSKQTKHTQTQALCEGVLGQCAHNTYMLSFLAPSYISQVFCSKQYAALDNFALTLQYAKGKCVYVCMCVDVCCMNLCAALTYTFSHDKHTHTHKHTNTNTHTHTHTHTRIWSDPLVLVRRLHLFLNILLHCPVKGYSLLCVCGVWYMVVYALSIHFSLSLSRSFFLYVSLDVLCLFSSPNVYAIRSLRGRNIRVVLTVT